jgi:hypothetical protein
MLHNFYNHRIPHTLPHPEKGHRLSFTLAEAKQLIGTTVEVKVDEPFEIHDGIILYQEQEGTIVGVSGEYSPEGTPILAVAIQFWPIEDDDLPIITLVEQSAFTTHFALVGKEP